jgi:hypothetical protein
VPAKARRRQGTFEVRSLLDDFGTARNLPGDVASVNRDILAAPGRFVASPGLCR